MISKVLIHIWFINWETELPVAKSVREMTSPIDLEEDYRLFAASLEECNNSCL